MSGEERERVGLVPLVEGKIIGTDNNAIRWSGGIGRE